MAYGVLFVGFEKLQRNLQRRVDVLVDGGISQIFDETQPDADRGRERHNSIEGEVWMRPDPLPFEVAFVVFDAFVEDA